MIIHSQELRESKSADPLSVGEISKRVRSCPRLPALSTTSSALRELLNGENQFAQQISEVIRRDPSLTARLLRLVNTVQFGLRGGVTSIDQAVLYVGLRQVRQLVIVTPVIEQFTSVAPDQGFTWKQFWKHCIGTAIVTHELSSLINGPEDDTAYIAGLLHDVGKIVMAMAFPQHFREVRRRIEAGETDLPRVECDVLGADHAELGSLYLEHHQLDAQLIAAARFHHFTLNTATSPIVAAVQIADLLIREVGLGHSGNPARPTLQDCHQAAAWTVLLPHSSEAERSLIHQSVNQTLARLPMVLEAIV